MAGWTFPSAERRAELRAQGVVSVGAFSISLCASVAMCLGILMSTGDAGRLVDTFSESLVVPGERLPEQLTSLGRLVARVVGLWSVLVIVLVLVAGVVQQRGFFMPARALPNLSRLWPDRWLLGVGERVLGACGTLVVAICLSGLVAAGAVFTLSRWFVLPRGAMLASVITSAKSLLLVLLFSAVAVGLVVWGWERLSFLWRQRVPRELPSPQSEE